MVLTLHHVDEALARDEGTLKKVWVVSFRVAWLNEVWESMIGRAESVQKPLAVIHVATLTLLLVELLHLASRFEHLVVVKPSYLSRRLQNVLSNFGLRCLATVWINLFFKCGALLLLVRWAGYCWHSNNALSFCLESSRRGLGFIWGVGWLLRLICREMVAAILLVVVVAAFTSFTWLQQLIAIIIAAIKHELDLDWLVRVFEVISLTVNWRLFCGGLRRSLTYFC
jgi:hypothetical protein